MHDAVYYPIGCLTENSFNEDSEMIDTTISGLSGWKTSTPTNQGFSISFGALETTDTFIVGKVTYKNIKDLKRSRTLIDWKIDDGLGNIESGKGYFTSLSESATIDEFVSFSGNIEGYGLPQDEISFIFDTYKARVEADGGTITSENCLLEYIKQII